MGLSIRGWVALADLIGRYEQAEDEGGNPGGLAVAIDRIQAGLAVRLPFDVAD